MAAATRAERRCPSPRKVSTSARRWRRLSAVSMPSMALARGGAAASADAIDNRLLLLTELAAAAQLISQRADELLFPIAARLETIQLRRLLRGRCSDDHVIELRERDIASA